MVQRLIQHNFTHGELDRRLFSAVDLALYYKAAHYLRNVYVRPQGGVKRRHGLIFKNNIGIAPIAYKLAAFILDEGNEYILKFTVPNLTIYKDIEGVFTEVAILDAPAGYGAMPYSDTQLPDLQFAQNGNLLIITHPELPPIQRVNGGDDFTWLFTEMVFKNLPSFDFSNDYFTANFSLSEVGIKKNVTLYSDSAVFKETHINGRFDSIGNASTSSLGVAKITDVTGPSVAKVDIITAFDASLEGPNGDKVLGANCYLGEAAFGDITTSPPGHGWPKAISFYEDRLVFGGTTQLPQTLFLSHIGQFGNFDVGQGLDDEAIISTLSSADYNQIHYLVSDKTLQIFCNEAEFSSTQVFNEPLTPATASFRKQSANGSLSACAPQLIDNQTFYPRIGGRSIMSFAYEDAGNSYASQNASIMSANLIQNPIASAVSKGDGEEDADYLFFANEDGSLLTFQTLVQQGIAAWTLGGTGPELTDLTNLVPNMGKFEQLVTVRNKVYAGVTRFINGTYQNHIELLSFDAKTDCAFKFTFQTPTSEISGLNTLIGQTVRVIGDGYVLESEVVSDSGTITISRPSINVEVGLNFNLLVQPLPVNIPGSLSLYVPKRLVRCWIDYYESIGIKINNKVIPELAFGPNTLDTPVQPSTGVYEHDLQGWAERTSFQITQDDPLPFLVIGIGYEVST